MPDFFAWRQQILKVLKMSFKNGHPHIPCQRFKSLSTYGLSIASAFSRTNVVDSYSSNEFEPSSRFLGGIIPSQIGECGPAGHEAKVHLQLPIRTYSCRCFSIYSLSEFGSRPAHQEIMEMDPMEVSHFSHQVRRDFRNRAQKMPKLDNLVLHALLFDDPPSLDVSNNSMGVNSIRNMLEVHDRAIALCQGAHLANLKAYTHKFLGFLTAKYDGDLRNPSVLEAQSADQKVWTVIAELMEKGWAMDDCLHEMTNLRHDLPGLLQPRPRALRSLPPPSSQTSSPRMEGPKGKGQGKSKGKQNAGKSKGRTQWITEVQRDGNFKQICMRFQLGKCQNSNCGFQPMFAHIQLRGRPAARTTGRCRTLPRLTDSLKGIVTPFLPCMTKLQRQILC